MACDYMKKISKIQQTPLAYVAPNKSCNAKSTKQEYVAVYVFNVFNVVAIDPLGSRMVV